MMPAAHPTQLLMYHSLAKPGHVPSRQLHKFVLGTHLFEEQLAWLKDEGYSSVTVAQYLNQYLSQHLKHTILSEKTALENTVPEKTALEKITPRKTVILTFDDALADFELALPLLKKYGFTATLFVPTAFVGGKSGWLNGADAQHPMLSWGALRDLAREGIDIAAHGHGHLQLDAVSLSMAQKDIARGKGMLEHYLGQETRGFAYPYGYYNKAVKRLVKEAGFAGACAVDKRSGSPDAFALPRLTVRGGMGVQAFARLMTRQDSALGEASGSLKAVLWRTARQVRRSLNTSHSQPSTYVESRQ